MDNHRAALWCWLQHVSPEKRHSLFHIDRHYDTLTSRMKTWLKHLPENWQMTVDEYLAHSYEHDDGKDIQLFSFDNYLSIYLKLFSNSINACWFATHDDGDKPRRKFCDPKLWELPQNLDYWIKPDDHPWIVNIDLDYFFCDGAEDGQVQMVSDDYIGAIFDAVRLRTEDGSIAVTTIALSPEYSGGWEQSERAMVVALKRLGLEFKLP